VPAGGTAGQQLQKTSTADFATAWVTPPTIPTTLPPSGPAGGDLGAPGSTYPNPTIAPLAVTDAKINDVAATKLTGTIAQARLPVAPSGLLTANLNDGQVTDAKIASVAWSKVTGAPGFLPLTGGTVTGPISVAPTSSPTCSHDAIGITIWRGGQAVSLTSPSTDRLELSGAAGPWLGIAGGGQGVRYQGVGTAVVGAYSNIIAFGWNGTLQARVDATVIGTVSVTAPSDGRLKIDRQEDVPGLAAVTALRAVSFAYDQTKRAIGFAGGRHYGLIAQEAQPHVPLAVTDDGSTEHWLSVDYAALVPVLIRAVQELAARVAQLEAARG